MNHYQQIVSLANQVAIFLNRGNYKAALKSYGDGLNIAKQLNRTTLIAVLLNRSGNAFQAQNNIQQAVIAYESALQALELEDEFKVDSVINRLRYHPIFTNPKSIEDIEQRQIAIARCSYWHQ